MKRFVTPAPRASVWSSAHLAAAFATYCSPSCRKEGKPDFVTGFPRQLRFSLYLRAKSKSRKKLDHGESRAVLFAQRNKFLALPKSHNFTSCMLTNRQGETLFGGPAWQKRKAAPKGGGLQKMTVDAD